MHSLTFLTTLVALVSATYTNDTDCNSTTTAPTCLTQASAEKVADNFAHIFSNFTEEFANQTLAIDVTDQTDSVCWLMSNGTNCPCQIGTETLSNRREFLDAQATQPNLPFLILNVWHDCTNVFARWKFDIQPQAVQGIAVLQVIEHTDPAAAAEQPYLIKNVFSEFNTGAFLVYRGDFVGTPPEGEGCAAEKIRRDGFGRMRIERT